MVFIRGCSRCAQGNQRRKTSNCGEDPAPWLPLEPLPGDEHAARANPARDSGSRLGPA
jgi:hypothetical protein